MRITRDDNQYSEYVTSVIVVHTQKCASILNTIDNTERLGIEWIKWLNKNHNYIKSGETPRTTKKITSNYKQHGLKGACRSVCTKKQEIKRVL